MLPINDMRELIKETIIEMLEKDKEFRYAMAGAIGLQEILKRLDKHEEILLRHEEELKKLREDMITGFKRHDEEIAKLREDMIAGFRRHDEEIAKLREDMITGFKRHDEEIAKLREDMNNGFKLLRNQISALGARWGIMSEKAFRAGIRGIIEKELGMKVEEWIGKDKEGFVFGFPSDIEIDVAISDGKVILIEVKSSISQGDVLAFKRKAEFYERETGIKPSRLIIVTPFADDKAIELASNFGIEIFNA
ncbi:MAG: DUF3782 domain-containing protein [Archaeoglobaceae archaeon]